MHLRFRGLRWGFHRPLPSIITAICAGKRLVSIFSFQLTGGSDVKAGTGDVDEEDTTIGGLGAVSDTTAATDTTARDTTTKGGLTQAQQDLIDAGTTTPTTVTSAADTATVGGLNQLAGDQDTATNAATTAATTGAAATGAAGTNLLNNILKKTVVNTANTGARNVVNRAAGRRAPSRPTTRGTTRLGLVPVGGGYARTHTRTRDGSFRIRPPAGRMRTWMWPSHCRIPLFA